MGVRRINDRPRVREGVRYEEYMGHAIKNVTSHNHNIARSGLTDRPSPIAVPIDQARGELHLVHCNQRN